MFVELVESLRCPAPHEESPLVAAAERTVDRDIVSGTLGCPVCRREYPIVEGVAHFDAGAPVARAAPAAASEMEAMRLAALLDLTDPRGVALLFGAWGSHARLVQRLTDAHLLLVNPPAGIAMGQGISGLVVPRALALPLAPGMARGAAVEDDRAVLSLADVVRVLRPRGRVLAPVRVAVPAEVTELARDEQVWVGESAAARGSGFVPLGRRSGA